jgi:hypothetical protein
VKEREQFRESEKSEGALQRAQILEESLADWRISAFKEAAGIWVSSFQPSRQSVDRCFREDSVLVVRLLRLSLRSEVARQPV